jgi:hypothetical protein
MRLSRLLSKHSADAANIQESNNVNHFNLCATIWKVLWRTINLGRQISDISKKSMQATIYCHYD